jgi:hypothetical protein
MQERALPSEMPVGSVTSKLDKYVGRQVVQPVDEPIAFYAIEPFYLHRLELAGRLDKHLAVGPLSGRGYRTYGAGQCLTEIDGKNLDRLEPPLLLLDQRFDYRAFGKAAAVMFAKDREMNENVAFAVITDEKSKTARRVKPFDASSDVNSVRRNGLLLGVTKDCMPNYTGSATSGNGFGRLVGTRTHGDLLARTDGFLKMNR